MLEQDWRLAIVVILVMSVAFLVLYALRRSRRRRKGRARGHLLVMALDNMTQGVVMFDAAERLVVCNDRFIEMYGLSRDVVRLGCTFLDVINNRKITGSLDIDIEKYRAEVLAAMAQGKTLSRVVETPDGRAISVVNRPIAGHAFWLGMHDDITERIQAERQSTFLLEDERRRVFIESEINFVSRRRRESATDGQRKHNRHEIDSSRAVDILDTNFAERRGRSAAAHRRLPAERGGVRTASA